MPRSSLGTQGCTTRGATGDTIEGRRLSARPTDEINKMLEVLAGLGDTERGLSVAFLCCFPDFEASVDAMRRRCAGVVFRNSRSDSAWSLTKLGWA